MFIRDWTTQNKLISSQKVSPISDTSFLRTEFSTGFNEVIFIKNQELYHTCKTCIKKHVKVNISMF